MGNEASQEGEGEHVGPVGGGQSQSGYGLSGSSSQTTPGPMFAGGSGSMGIHSSPPSAPVSRRSSSSSLRSMPPMGITPGPPPVSNQPDVDLSHLSEEERAMIASVMARAQNLEEEPQRLVRCSFYLLVKVLSLRLQKTVIFKPKTSRLPISTQHC